MTIHDIELEINLLDAQVMEQFEREMERVRDSRLELEGKKASEIIRMQCTLVHDCFERLFGEEVRRELFGDRFDILECLDAFEILAKEGRVQTAQLQKRLQNYGEQISEPKRSRRKTKQRD